MTFTRLTDGRSGTVHYTALEVRRSLFWNTWAEADGTSVARVEDFESGKVYAIVHFPDGKIVNLTGTFRKLD
jgi:MoaF-like